MIWSQIKVAKGCHNLQKKSSGRTFCVKVGQKDNLQKFQQNCREWQLANFANNLSRPTIKKETTNCAYQPLGGRQQCSIFQEPLLSPPPLITRQAHCNNDWKTKHFGQVWWILDIHTIYCRYITSIPNHKTAFCTFWKITLRLCCARNNHKSCPSHALKNSVSMMLFEIYPKLSLLRIVEIFSTLSEGHRLRWCICSRQQDYLSPVKSHHREITIWPSKSYRRYICLIFCLFACKN